MTSQSLFASCVLALAIGLASAQESSKTHARVFGQFVDSRGQPVAAVVVKSQAWPGTEFSTQSNADGRFESIVEWDRDHGNTWYLLEARCVGFSKHSHRCMLRSNEELDLGSVTLPPGSVITGRILAQEGTALANTSVFLIDASKSTPPKVGRDVDGFLPNEVTEYGTSDVDGRIRIVGVPPGKYFARYKHETRWWYSSEVFIVRAGGDVDLPEVRLELLPDDYRIEGEVLDPDGRPVQGAKVETSVEFLEMHVDDVGMTMSADATSDTHGRFVLYLPRLPKGSLVLRATVPDERFDEATLTEVPAGARNITMRLGAFRELHLKVVDEEGQPVESFSWSLEIEKPGQWKSTGSNTAKHLGGLTALRVPDCPIEIEVRSPTHNARKFGPFEPSRTPDPIEVRLTAMPSIHGVVLYEGQPVRGALVELTKRDFDALDRVLPAFWNGMYSAPKRDTTTTDATGHFQLHDDSPYTTWYAHAFTEGVGEAVVGPVKSGGASIVVELQRGGTLEGTVSAPSIRDLRGVVLELRRKDATLEGLSSELGCVYRTRLDEAGAYKLQHIAPGPWRVHVQVDGTLTTNLDWDRTRLDELETIPHIAQVSEGETTRLDLDLARRELCRLNGELRVSDLIREARCYLMLEGPIALRVATGRVDEQGRFHLAVRQPGAYRLVIDAGPGRPQYSRITDIVSLSAGDNAWKKDLPVESWKGEAIRLDQH